MSSEGVAVGLRERKREATRNRLIEAAFSLFEANGFEGTTVEAIAEAAGVSRRTWFRYFATKESVVFFDHAELVEGYKILLRSGPPGESRIQAVRRTTMVVVDSLIRERASLLVRGRIIGRSPALVLYELDRDREWEDAAAEFLGDVSDAAPRLRRRARVVSAALVGAIRQLVRAWREEGAVGDLASWCIEAFELFDRGLDPDLDGGLD